MVTLREAAQQALVALELEMKGYADKHARLKPAAHALRTALAEPTPLEDALTYGTAWTKGGKRIDPMSVYAEPTVKESLTDEPVQPVAYWHKRGQDDEEFVHAEAVNGHCPDCEPLYLAPPQRKPLTDEEISSIWDGHIVPVFGKNGINPVVFARAIEAAHGIGDSNE